MTHDLPLLEFDPERSALIEPHHTIAPVSFPELAVACFFRDVIDDIVLRDNLVPLTEQRSEMGQHPIYEITYRKRRIAIYHAGSGAPLSASLLEGAIALGAKVIIACGGAGALDPAIPLGQIIVPTAAIRDEGTSYHYLPPGREVAANPLGLELLREVLETQDDPYLFGKTWTTDAIFRETRSKIQARRAEGALVVEMETAALFAVGAFRNVLVAQLLYAGDNVGGDSWDHRDWSVQRSIRKALFFLACEACCDAPIVATDTKT
jgi:uridine phosphorylase